MRLAALHRCRPLHGPELISAWQARAVYPDQLVAAVVERSLGPDVLRGWGAREALADRGDDLAGLLPRNVLHGARSGNLTLTERTLRTTAMCASITHGDAARTIIAA